jgi:YHS domain-containing protein
MKSLLSPVIAAATFLLAATTTPVAFAEGAVQTKEETKAKRYAPTTCIVSGDKLGEMGKPVVFEYKGQEIKLCCKDCRKDFDKDPAKYLKKLEGKKEK